MEQTTGKGGFEQTTGDEGAVTVTTGGLPQIFQCFEKDFGTLALLPHHPGISVKNFATIEETRVVKEAIEKFYAELSNISTVYFKGTEIEVVLNVFLNLWNVVVQIVHDNIKILTRESELELEFDRFKLDSTTSIEELKFKLDQLESQTDTRDTKFTIVQDFLRTRVSTLQTLFTTLVNDGGLTLALNAQLDIEVDNIRKKYEQRTIDVMSMFNEAMDKEIQETRDAYDEYVNTYVTEIRKLVDVEQLDTDIQQWKGKFETLVEEHVRNTIDTKEDEITKLKTEKTTLEEEVETLRREKEALLVEKLEQEHLFTAHHEALHEAADELRRFKNLFDKDAVDTEYTTGSSKGTGLVSKGSSGLKGVPPSKGALPSKAAPPPKGSVTPKGGSPRLPSKFGTKY